MIIRMDRQAALRLELDRLLEADLLEEAELLIESIEVIDGDAFSRRLDSAPIDDEPLTALSSQRLELARKASAALVDETSRERQAG